MSARVCVIPARGGSKRIEHKNRRQFCGRPIIGWSIEVALSSGLFDHVIVTTDDAAIAEVALAEGAEVPFERPAALSDDWTPTNPVVAHVVERLQRSSYPVDLACCLYPTAPFVTGDDLRLGLALLEQSGAEFAFACTSFTFPVQRALLVDDRGRAQPMFPDWIGHRSQDLPEALHDAGQFYWGSPEAFRSHRVVFEADAVPVPIPRWRVQDIDTLEDWDRAELMFRALRKR